MSEFPHLQIVVDTVKADLGCSDEEAMEHALLGSASLARAAGIDVPEDLNEAVMESILAEHGLKMEEFANKARLPEKPGKKPAAGRRKPMPRKKNKFV